MHVIELGTKVRDTVSGWAGIATARYEYMNGCERYEVSGTDKDGKPEGFTFDWQQLEVEATDRGDFGEVVWTPALPQTGYDLAMGVESGPAVPRPAVGSVGEMLAALGRRRSGGPRGNRPVQR